MALKPIKILKKGLSKLTEKIKDHRDELNTKLAWKETILSLDEHWLDNEANTVGEQHVIDTLESTSDYEQEFQRLNENGKMTEKTEGAGNLAKVPGNKWKHIVLFECRREACH